MGRYDAFESLREDWPLERVRALLPIDWEARAQDIEELLGHPLAVLLLDDELLADLKLSTLSPIAGALSARDDGPISDESDALYIAWRHYAAE